MDITTIEALQNGHHKAFEEVFLTYFDKVKYLLTGLLRSESDAEELAQDISLILEDFYNLFIYKRFEGKDKIEVTNWQPCLFLRFAVSCYQCHSS